MEREKLGSRLGFILLSAGCAIGVGNVWKFPYMCGQYGGGAFVLFYIFFLVSLGLPIMTMEFAVGRASQKSPIKSFQVLEKTGQKWHLHGYVCLAANYLLMMFYTVVAGWMLHYFYMTATGQLSGLDSSGIEAKFGEMLTQPGTLVFWMVVIVVLGFAICGLGVKNGVEKSSKFMMLALLVIMVVLAINSMMMPGASEGLKFYLIPDFNRMAEIGIGETIVGAMNQSFFTLSLGIGSMAIFGSYIGKDRTLFGESINIAILDTFVAVVSGLIIFPACFAYGVQPDSGPNLIFITLPNIFNNIPGGRFWGSLFFVFLAFAAFSTVIAVFENIISCLMDLTGADRKKLVIINTFLVILLSLPCALGFNVWSGIQPLGAGSGIMDLEDFIVSNWMLPLGSLVYLIFCVTRYGWGWDNFLKEANTGKGIKMPGWMRWYLTYLLPIVVLTIFVIGVKNVLFK